MNKVYGASLYHDYSCFIRRGNLGWGELTIRERLMMCVAFILFSLLSTVMFIAFPLEVYSFKLNPELL
jgi:hypothetical protein